MANHTIKIRGDVMFLLCQATNKIKDSMEAGSLPNYPTFVDRLFKGMNTVAEEAHHAATGMSGEAGEILDQTKKVWIYGKEFDIAHLVEEMGDLRFYYQAMLNLLGMTDADIVAQNVIKLSKRYSEGVYSDKAAIERKDKQPAPISAEGGKGTGEAEPRRFMGQPACGAGSERINDEVSGD